MKIGHLGCILLVLVLNMSAQEKAAAHDAAATASPETVRPLPLKASVRTQFAGKTPKLPVKCDDDGNIYLQLYNFEAAVNGTVLLLPIQKIKPDGSLAETFKVKDALPDIGKNEGVLSFTVDGDGTVNVIVGTFKGLRLVSFAKDGSVKTTTNIEKSDFLPSHFAMFKSGSALISGIGGEQDHTPFTAVMDSSGKMVMEVKPEEDEKFKKQASAGDVQFVSSGTPGRGNTAVSSGESVAASDGNIYVLRQTYPAMVYAISPSGEIVRSFSVDPGDPGLMPVSIKAAPGTLAIHFLRDRKSDNTIKTIDFEGHNLATYSVADGRHIGIFSCYLPPDFIFTSAKDEFIELRRVGPN